MAARLDALVREYFGSLSGCSLPSSRKRQSGHYNSTSTIAATTGGGGCGLRETDGTATATSHMCDFMTGDLSNNYPKGNNPNLKSIGPSFSSDDVHFLPPLLQYFGGLVKSSTVISPTSHVLSGGTLNTTSAGKSTLTTGSRSFSQSLSRGNAVLMARHQAGNEARQSECGVIGTSKGSFYSRPSGGRRPSIFRYNPEEKQHAAEWIDVFANYTQPPLTYSGISYEALGRNHQKGLNALVALVEHYNRSFVHERNSAAPFAAIVGTQSAFATNNTESTASAANATAGPADNRDAIVNCLNNFLYNLLEHGKRVLALHIIIRVVSWRFASKNERVTILFNHIVTCLPSVKMSTAILAMEAWGQLHVIEASSSIYLEVTRELLSLACNFLQHDGKLDGQLTGLVIIRHVALWPTSLYRALLSNERDSLLLATWTSLCNDRVPAHIRELAAETLRALFIVALEQRSYRSVHSLMQHAIKLLLPYERLTDLPSMTSLLSLQQMQQPGGSGLHDVVSDATTWQPLLGPLAVSEKTRRSSENSRDTKVNIKRNSGTSSSTVHRPIMKVFSLIQNMFGGSKRHRSTSSNLNISASSCLSDGYAKTAFDNAESNISAGSHFALPGVINTVFTADVIPSSTSRLSRQKLQWRLSQMPLPADRDIALHAGTLVVGAFVGAVRFCFRSLEQPNVDMMEKNLKLTATTGIQRMVPTTTMTGTTVEQATAMNFSMKRFSSWRSLCVGSVCSGRCDTSSRLHDGKMSFEGEKYDIGVVSNSTETDESSGSTLPGREEDEPQMEGDKVDDDDAEGDVMEDGPEWVSFGTSMRMDCSTYATSSLRRQRPMRVSTRRTCAPYGQVTSVPERKRGEGGDGADEGQATDVTKCLLGRTGRKDQHHHRSQRHRCLHRPFFTEPGEERNRGAPSQFGGINNKAADLENILSSSTVRKLLALCLSSDTRETASTSSSSSSTWHTERLLPILALYSPHSLQAHEVESVLRILFNRVTTTFHEFSDLRSRGIAGEIQRCNASGMMCRGNYNCSLSLINIGLFLAAIAESHPFLFQRVLMKEFYPILFCALQYGTQRYCSAAFPVLALIVHNIPVECRERFRPIVEQLTEMAISAPFTGEMTGIAMTVCAIYKELRPRCQAALLQSIAKVLAEGGTMQKCAESNVVSDKGSKPNVNHPEMTASPQPNVVLAALQDTSFANLEEKIMCFRVLQGFCMDWEGTALFFLEVCTPYMHHQDPVLRRECVLSCVSLLLSDCFRRHCAETDTRALANSCMEPVTCNQPSVPLTDAELKVARAATQQFPSKIILWGLGAESNYFIAQRRNLFPLLSDDNVRNSITTTTTTTTTTATATSAVINTGLKGTETNNKSGSFFLKKGVSTLEGGDMNITCNKHTGRSHINTLREVLHRLVEVAVCDPEESVRYVALSSLSPATDQFLCTHTEIIDLLFTSLNDEYSPNCMEAVSILRRIAQYTPSKVYPRLRKFLLQMIHDFQARSFFPLSHSEGTTPTAMTVTTITANINMEKLQLLFELVRAVPHSIVLHMDSILQLLQQVLKSHRVVERGTVVIALHMLSYLMDESTRMEWHKFEVLLEPLSAQLLLRDGDAKRLHATIGALQKLIQGVVVIEPFYNKGDLRTIVRSLQLLLHQKPSIGSELSLVVLKLLGTISSIEPYHQMGVTNGTALLLGRQDFERLLPFPLHINTVSLWSKKHQYDQVRTQFTEHMWSDVILRLLLRTFVEAINGILAFTNEELGACLQATVAILRETETLQKLERYMPLLLTVLWDLLNCTEEDASLRVSTMESIAELVQLAGRAIAPTYALLVAFLEQHLVSSWYALASCCKLLMALCTAVPDLVQEHCEWFLSLLLDKLMQLVGETAPVFSGANPQGRFGTSSSLVRSPVVGSSSTLTVIHDVLKAIRFLLPIADQLTIQSACLTLAQLLRNPASTSEPVQLEGSDKMQQFVSTTSTVFEAEVSCGIVQVLVDFVNSCDVTTTAMAVVESLLVQLWYYARVHKTSLQSLTEKIEQQHERKQKLDLRGKKLWSLLQTGATSVVPALNRTLLERELCWVRGDQRMWFNNSLLARLVLRNTEKDSETTDASFFPFDEDVTSWESPLEMDLFACVLLVVGRCRLSAKLYDLMLGEYVDKRFDPSSLVKDFVLSVTSSQRRLCILPVGVQQQQLQTESASLLQPQERRKQEQEREQEQKGEERVGQVLLGSSFADPTTFEASLCTHMDTRCEGSCIFATNEVRLHSSPIPIRATQQSRHGSRSSSVSLPKVALSSLTTVEASSLDGTTQRYLAKACTPETIQSGLHGTTPSSLVRPGGGNVSILRSAVGVVSGTLTGGGSFVKSSKSHRQKDVPSSDRNSPTVFDMEGVGTGDERVYLTTVKGSNDDKNQNSNDEGDDDDIDDSMDEGDETDEQRFFRQHENISVSEWRPWFEQFCTMLVESSDHVCVRSCSPLVRRHFTIFFSELLPIAFLSHLTKCNDGVVRRWIQLICDFAHMHDNVPYIIAAEMARLAHHIRLYGPYLFSKSLVRAIENKYITLDLLSELAERALNPPLLLLYTEQKMLNGFSWEALARVAVAAQDVLGGYKPQIASLCPFVCRAVHQLLQPKRNSTRESNVSDDAIARDEMNAKVLSRGTQRCNDNDKSDTVDAFCTGEIVVNDGEKDYTPHPVFLELCWIDVALRVYVRSILEALRVARDNTNITSTAASVKPLLSLNDVVGAMRCYMQVYDFESILNIWTMIKEYFPTLEYDLSSSVQTKDEQLHERVQRILQRTVCLPSTESIFPQITRYVVSAAQALSRWDIVDEIHSECFFPVDCAKSDYHNCNNSDFSFFKQREIFRASALTASKEYEKAKEVLTALRTALKDSYAVFYTENSRLKLELSIMFEQISDLEEGIDAIELKSALGDTTSRAAGNATPNVSNLPLPVSGGNPGEHRRGSVGGGGGGRDGQDPHQSRWRGRLAYTEATVRRLQNIADRPLFTHTVLQRFETIALRSTLVSPEWQLRNILMLCEHIACEGMPRRAVQTITYFYSLPIDSNDTQEERKYRDTLLLERYRLELQHLCRTRDLERLQSEITETLELRCDCMASNTHSMMHLTGLSDASDLGCFRQGPISKHHAELLLLYLECRRKLKNTHKRRRRLSLDPAPILAPCPILGSGSSTAAGNAIFSFCPTTPRLTSPRDAEDDESPEGILLCEYRLMERIIDSSTMVASIWREFGLLLFDICMAIYAEWNSTKESETLDNFCVQSEKAINALQKSAQFWSSAAFTSITGIGPFTSASTRSSHHARFALPVTHLLLKSLHLALKLEKVGAEGACINNNNRGCTSQNGVSDDKSTAALPATLVGRGSGAGFAQLDFSPAMHFHWGCLLPFLMNAAARHPKLHDAVRTMCVQSRAMLYQCVYLLVSTFEHGYHSVLGQETAQQKGALLAGESYKCDVHSTLSFPKETKTVTTSNMLITEELTSDDVLRRTAQHRSLIVASESTHTAPQQQQHEKTTLTASSSLPSRGHDCQEEDKGVRSLSGSANCHHHRYSYDDQSQHPQQQKQWRSSMLLELAEIDSEYKLIISQTMQLCDFVRGGKAEALTLGVCALPVPMWLLQRHMAEIDTEDAKATNIQSAKANFFSTSTNNNTHSEQESGAKNSSKALQRILHVRRKFHHVFSDGRHEEVFLFFMSDGSRLRFHRSEVLKDISASALLPCLVIHSETHQRLNDTSTVAAAGVYTSQSASFTASTGGYDTTLSNTPLNPLYQPDSGVGVGGKSTLHTEMSNNLAFIRPSALMESAMCCFLAHLPLECVYKSFVLPVALQEFITQLPDGAVYYSSWQVTLPPSLQFYSTASVSCRPWSLFHIVSEYSALRSGGDTFQDNDHQQHERRLPSLQQETETSIVNELRRAHSIQLAFTKGRNLKNSTEASSVLHSECTRKKLVAKYESLLEKAFDKGEAWELHNFIHKVLCSRKLTDAEYPRPASQLRELLSEMEKILQSRLQVAEGVGKMMDTSGKSLTVFFPPDVENEENQSCERRGLRSSMVRRRQRESKQLSPTLRKQLQLVILKAEAPLFAEVLRHAFQAESANAAKWLDATNCYTRELAEWSMIQYLFDVTHRESTTFFIEAVTGHVASHHLGVHSLQSLPKNVISQQNLSMSTGKDEVTCDTWEEPLPCTDPTIFRLTGCLVSQLPAKCPYGVFLLRAAYSLYSMLHYQRDITGTVKFGFEDLKCFAWSGVMPLPLSDGEDTNTSSRRTCMMTLPDMSNQGSVRITEPVTKVWPCKMSESVCVNSLPMGESPDTAFGGGIISMMETTVALDERVTDTSSLIKMPHNSITGLNSFATSNLPGNPLQVEATTKEERDQPVVSTTGNNNSSTAGAFSPPAYTPAADVEVTRKVLSSPVNTAAPDSWGVKTTFTQRRFALPRLFDGTSIIAKLKDDLLPMSDEPCLDPFPDPHLQNADCLIHLYPTGNNTMMSTKGSFTGDEKCCLLHTVTANATATGQNKCDVVETVVDRVNRLIRAAVDQENLLGTLEAPHSWCHWAPHW